MSAKKKRLYIQTGGTDTPQRTCVPFVLAVTLTDMALDADAVICL